MVGWAPDPEPLRVVRVRGPSGEVPVWGFSCVPQPASFRTCPRVSRDSFPFLSRRGGYTAPVFSCSLLSGSTPFPTR